MSFYVSDKRDKLSVILTSFSTQAKPAQEDGEKLSSILNIPQAHIDDDLGPDFYPDRGGWVNYATYDCRRSKIDMSNSVKLDGNTTNGPNFVSILRDAANLWLPNEGRYPWKGKQCISVTWYVVRCIN